MKASGESTSPPGSRNGRSACGIRRPSAPDERGASAYISTQSLVIRPPSDCRQGNGRKQMHPTTKEGDAHPRDAGVVGALERAHEVAVAA
jgi:hypothetical protein